MWFPDIMFQKKAADKPWNMKLSHSLLKMSYHNEPTARKNSAAVATVCVQAMGHSNWPNGVKSTILGPCSFPASAFQSHDIKRGAMVDLAFSGV
jgi:hypothetical protein